MIRRALALAIVCSLTVLVGTGQVEAKKRPRVRAKPRPLQVAIAPRVSLETAGAQGSVIAAVDAKALAIGVLWPIEGPQDRTAMIVAADVLIEWIASHCIDCRPSRTIHPRGVQLGIIRTETPESVARSRAQLLDQAAVLFDPPGEILNAWQPALASGAQAPREWSSRRAIVNQAVVAMVLGSLAPLPPTSSERSALDREQLEQALNRVRSTRLEVRGLGPTGWAAEIAARYGARAGSWRAIEFDEDDLVLPQQVEIVEVELDREADGSTHLGLGFRVADSTPDAWATFARALEQGDASLSQRIAVSCRESTQTSAQWLEVDSRLGALVLTASVPAACAQTARTVLAGAIDSWQALTLRDDVLRKAWNRVGVSAAEEWSRPEQRLLALFHQPGLVWPPASRERRERNGADIAAMVRPFLRIESSAQAELRARDDRTARTARRTVSWSRFDPWSANLQRDQDLIETDEEYQRAGREAASQLLVRLVRNANPTSGAYRARYQVHQETPLGEATTELELVDRGGQTSVVIGEASWRLQAETTDTGSAVVVQGSAWRAADLPTADQVGLWRWREPSSLAHDVVSGVVTAYSALAPCSTGVCPALRVEPADGTRLMLLLDRATRRPQALKIWYPGSREQAAPDELVTYHNWFDADGVDVASSFSIADQIGTTRRFDLTSWRWE
jgi:hypothetical protein